MATTLTGFNDSRLMGRMIASLKATLMSAKAVSFAADLGDGNAGKTKGDTVNVPVMGAMTSTTRVLGAAGASQGSGTVVPVTLADPISAQWDTIDGATKAGTFEALAIEGVNAAAKGALNTIFAVATGANFGNTTADKLVCSSADFNMDQVGLALDKAITKKVGADKSLVLNGAYATKLLTNGTYALVLATTGDKSLQTGIMPPLMGMQSYMYSELPSNSENLVGLICGKTAIAAGMAPVKAQAQSGMGDLVFEQIVVDPETDLGFSYRVWYKSDEGKLFGRVELMITAVKVQDALVRIVSA